MSERAERIHFGSIKEGIEPPNLIEVQLNSYVDFLQKDVAFNKRKNYGLQAVFKEVFPIQSYDEKATLDFSHRLLVRHHLRSDQLDRNVDPQLGVPSLVYGAHATQAEQPLDVVPAAE